MNGTQPIGRLSIWPAQAAIWQNGEFYNVTFSKSYKDGDEYKSTTSFGRDELLLLAKLADQAHTWILRKEREDRAKGQEAQSE